MHAHVDSAYTDQDAPAESHTEAKEEWVLKERDRDMTSKNINIDIRKVVKMYKKSPGQFEEEDILQIFVKDFMHCVKIYSQAL